MEQKRVVVTGLGTMCPSGSSIDEFWNNLKNGVSGAGPITRFDASKFKTRFACEVKDYKATDFFDRKDTRKIDLFAQFAIVASDQAFDDSNLNPEDLDLDRSGVIWGSGIGGLETFYSEISAHALGDGTPRFSPFFVPKMIIDIAAGHISIKYGFRGMNYATVSACASSTHAMVDSLNYIRQGKQDVIITGGSEAPINIPGLAGFTSIHAVSSRNDDPATASRPFDKDRDGFVLAEGGACLIFEELEHAKRRGAKIYAEVIGAGMTADAHHITAPHPEGLGAYNVMKNTLEDAGIKPEDVDHINTHGTSTPLGDIAEPKAIEKLFGKHAKNISINSTKSMHGHLLGGAGAVESIASILAMNHSIIPPTINHFTDDPEIPDLDFTFNEAKERDVNIALSNTFGFGGHNACVAFKKYEE